MNGISYLKKYLLSKSHRQLATNQGNLQVNKSSIKQVIFIAFCEPGKESVITDSKKFLEKQFPQVKTIIFSSKPTDKIQETTQIGPGDFSRFMKIVNPELNQMIRNKHDLCICYNPLSTHELHLLTIHSNATIKIGIDKPGEKYYDILIEMNDNREIMRFLQHVLQLITNLSTHE